MERTADPRIYSLAVAESVQPGQYALDNAPFTYSPKSDTFPNTDVDTPIVVVPSVYKPKEQSELLRTVQTADKEKSNY